MARKGNKEASAVQVERVERKEAPIPSVRKPLKKGPPPKEVAPSDWNRVLDGASLGIPFDRLCHLAGMTDELRLLGNGVVPHTAELAFRVLIQELANE